ncbi:FG-GAP repeat domain-containing protein, partial [Streptomyces sp. NPDC058667]|uniref:FG-GAP repeat domain-containing protein n=1 Tax=Streptomyces sp. NPDC058667 TaxID=3346588 RepID=UPI0036565C4D
AVWSPPQKNNPPPPPATPAAARPAAPAAPPPAGDLWLYLGNGDGTFAARTRIGGGWNTYDEIIAIGDADRDGRPDLLANGPDGRNDELALYSGTGDWKVPFAARSWLYAAPPLTGSQKTLF